MRQCKDTGDRKRGRGLMFDRRDYVYWRTQQGTDSLLLKVKESAGEKKMAEPIIGAG